MAGSCSFTLRAVGPTEMRFPPTMSVAGAFVASRTVTDLALAGGADGMDFVRPLLAALPALLNEDGVLILEIGHERAYFEAAFPQLAPVWLTTSMGCEQVLLLTREALLA